jgi:hypothetical protein
MTIAITGSMVYVNGRESTTAMDELIPGRAPHTIPNIVPTKISKKLVGLHVATTDWIKMSISDIPPDSVDEVAQFPEYPDAPRQRHHE